MAPTAGEVTRHFSDSEYLAIMHNFRCSDFRSRVAVEYSVLNSSNWDIYISVSSIHTHTGMHTTHKNACTHTHEYTHAHTYIHTHAHSCTHSHTHVHRCIHAQARTNTRTSGNNAGHKVERPKEMRKSWRKQCLLGTSELSALIHSQDQVSQNSSTDWEGAHKDPPGPWLKSFGSWWLWRRANLLVCFIEESCVKLSVLLGVDTHALLAILGCGSPRPCGLTVHHSWEAQWRVLGKLWSVT